MNSGNREETNVPSRYGRAQFLDDVTWMGLDPEQAFSPSSLRQQRDRLMQDHHPDRGGSEAMAARINVTYSRMTQWLDRRLHNRNYLRMRRDKAFAREAARNTEAPAAPPAKAKLKIEAAKIYAVILTTTAAVIGIGLTSLARRQR